MSYRALTKPSKNLIEMSLCLDLDDMQFVCVFFPKIISDLRDKFEVQETAFVNGKTNQAQEDELKATKYYLKIAESLYASAKTELARNDDLPF